MFKPCCIFAAGLERDLKRAGSVADGAIDAGVRDGTPLGRAGVGAARDILAAIPHHAACAAVNVKEANFYRYFCKFLVQSRKTLAERCSASVMYHCKVCAILSQRFR